MIQLDAILFCPKKLHKESLILKTLGLLKCKKKQNFKKRKHLKANFCLSES